MAKINKKQLDKYIKKSFNKILKLSRKELPPVLKEEIIDNHILKGKSPVDGEGRFDKYSPSYTRQIRKKKFKKYKKRTRPINLKLSGDLIESFYIKPNWQNKFRIGFTDPKAVYHDKDGAGKGKKIRRMLPRDGEQFTSRIRRKVKNVFKNIIKRLS